MQIQFIFLFLARFLTLVVCLWGIGCTLNEAPQASTPVEAPAAWVSERQLNSSEPTPWLTDFNDAALEALVKEALSNNYNLEISAARVLQASAESRITGADRLPSIGAGLDGTRQRTETALGSNYSNNYQLGLNLSWELDLWGRLGNKQKASTATALASIADYEAARLSLAVQVSKAWFNLKEATGQTEQAQKTVRAYRKNLNTLEARFQSGLSNSLELRQIRTELATSEAALKARQRLQAQASRTLELLLGRYPKAQLKSEGTLPNLQNPIPAGLPSQLLERRPDLQAAELRIRAAEYSVRASRKEFLPRLSLTGSAGTTSDAFENLLDQNYSVANLVGNLTQPLFQGGRIRAGLDRTKSQLAQAEASYHNIALQAFLEVENTLTSGYYLRREAAKTLLANTEASAAEELAWERYRNGTLDFINVLTSQRSAANARSRYLTIQNQLLQNRLDCLLALGGPFNPTS